MFNVNIVWCVVHLLQKNFPSIIYVKNLQNVILGKNFFSEYKCLQKPCQEKICQNFAHIAAQELLCVVLQSLVEPVKAPFKLSSVIC